MSNNICKIFYINLKKRTDRRELIEEELNNYNLEYERFEAFETPGFGILGCSLSHLAVLKIAKERNYDNVLILEDDFKFVVSKEEFESMLSTFFDLKIPFDICMISHNVLKYENTEYDFINKIIEGQTASGYIVNKNYYDKLIHLYEWSTPLLESSRQHWHYANDQVWKGIQPKDNWYYFINRIGKQRDGYSDNTELYVVDSFC
uniref:Glycosyl transferase family 25 domain-containing protein n=1 Tax=viral metagenome TaxID=1070528 RepID=A0A6C0ET45_9ZZZZ